MADILLRLHQAYQNNAIKPGVPSVTMNGVTSSDVVKLLTFVEVHNLSPVIGVSNFKENKLRHVIYLGSEQDSAELKAALEKYVTMSPDERNALVAANNTLISTLTGYIGIHVKKAERTELNSLVLTQYPDPDGISNGLELVQRYCDYANSLRKQSGLTPMSVSASGDITQGTVLEIKNPDILLSELTRPKLEIGQHR